MRVQKEVEERCHKEEEEQKKMYLKKIKAELMQGRIEEELEVETVPYAAGENDNKDNGVEDG